jgi:hypothetical protein
MRMYIFNICMNIEMYLHSGRSNIQVEERFMLKESIPDGMLEIFFLRLNFKLKKVPF